MGGGKRKKNGVLILSLRARSISPNKWIINFTLNFDRSDVAGGNFLERSIGFQNQSGFTGKFTFSQFRISSCSFYSPPRLISKFLVIITIACVSNLSYSPLWQMTNSYRAFGSIVSFLRLFFFFLELFSKSDWRSHLSAFYSQRIEVHRKMIQFEWNKFI